MFLSEPHLLCAPNILATVNLADRPTIYAVFAGFFGILVSVGLVFRRFSKDSSDYFRAGGRATWWLAGGSIFMQSFSAWTFTGAAGVAYQAGWSMVVMYCAGVVAAAVLAAGPAGWFRNLRAITPADTVRLRYGPAMEQLYAYLQTVSGPLFGGVQLYTLAIFISSLLGFSIPSIIITLGFVVLFYCAVSGAWAVLAADFIKGLILLPAAILLTVICLHEMGGLGGLVERIAAAGLQTAYAPIKSAATVASLPGVTAGYFTFSFFAGWYSHSIVSHASLINSGKFLSTKDTREARRAAVFWMALNLFGALIWFIPPMTARLLLAGEVAALPLKVPAEGAYAAIALHYLPPGLVGLVLVAVCAATMSSLDGGLTGLAGIITENIYPAICRRFKIQAYEGRARLIFGRFVNFLCALSIVGTALAINAWGSGGAFKSLLDVLALVLAPVALPMFLGLFVRRVPVWAPPVAIAAGFAVSAAIRFGPALVGAPPWFFHHQIFAVIGAGSLVILGSRLFAGRAEQQEREARFFALRDRPVDFEKEIGEDNSPRQFKIIGLFGLCIAAGILLLLLPESSAGHAAKILAVALGTAVTSATLYALGNKKTG